MAREIRRKRNRRAAIGPMRDRITIQRRSIDEPDFGGSDLGEKFDNARERWAAVETTQGKTFFGGVGVGDVPVTHRVTLRYEPEIEELGADAWISYKPHVSSNLRRLDVLSSQDLDERGEWLELLCNDRGDATLAASRA